MKSKSLYIRPEIEVFAAQERCCICAGSEWTDEAYTKHALYDDEEDEEDVQQDEIGWTGIWDDSYVR